MNLRVFYLTRRGLSDGYEKRTACSLKKEPTKKEPPDGSSFFFAGA